MVSSSHLNLIILWGALLAASCIAPPPAATPPPTSDSGADSMVDLGRDAVVDTTTNDDTRTQNDAGSDTRMDNDVTDAADVADLTDVHPDMAPDVPPTPPTALFVAGVPDPLTGSDARAVELLETADFVVELVDDDAVTAADADGVDLVVVSKSCSSSTLADSLADVPTGMFLWENRSQYQDRFNLISTTVADYNVWNRAQNTVWVEDGVDAALRGGASGSIDIHTSNMETWYVPESVLGAGATIVARNGRDASGVFAYAYDAGDDRPDGTGAPGRRAYVGYDEFTIDALTSDGESLFLALAQWAARR